MTTKGPGGEGTPEEPDGTPPAPEDIWLKFLSDSEVAIRQSAPKEPSALERAPGWHRLVDPADRTGLRSRRPHGGAADVGTDAVGDLWQPDEPWTGAAWRDLDDKAKLRRVVRVIATAAAITVTLGAWSCLPTSAGTAGNAPDDSIVQQVEEAPPELSPATRFPPGSAVAEPSSSAVTAG
ncbi:hypothetical protein [Streptomyces sp. NPDC054940]